MRRIAHLSDLHFGAVSHGLVDALLEDLGRVRPTLVAVSGDLTQRARPSESRDARALLDLMPCPTVVVPGNHDIPLFDPVRRFVAPLERYRRAIAPDLEPFVHDDEVAVLGLNTARSLTWCNGRVSREQLDTIRARFCAVPRGTFKVLVAHHPFLRAPAQRRSAVGRAGAALTALDSCQVDMLLTGHLHVPDASAAHHIERTARGSLLVVQAGTALSHRTRGSPNSYNVIALERATRVVTVAVRRFEGGRFVEASASAFSLDGAQWHRRATVRA